MERPRQRHGNTEEIKKGLWICSQWCYDGHGDAMKDCRNCPYRDETDPAGMNCGERLMRDAKGLIEDLEDLSRKQAETIRRCGKVAWEETKDIYRETLEGRKC